MIKPIFYVVGIVLMLAGCATETNSNVQYYLLDSSTSMSMPSDLSQRPKTVVVQSIELADYLKQAGLSMQLDEHQVYYSKQHFWAQPLQASIQNSLINDLNKHSNTALFSSSDEVNSASQGINLRVKINHFSPTFKSKVVLAGQYWIYNQQSQTELSTSMYHFKFELPLAKNGYGHAVGKLRDLLENLSEDIVENMDNVRN
ncbi:MAG: ABC-type transport auxiliary lipoprotein family protein [Aliiglaciecola sp.]|uniref:PqiC family protein n=1 Tax=Aliiglaciecola sp. TaxID=1872441 RepID=UPI003297DC54